MHESQKARMANSLVGYLGAVEKLKEAAAVGDQIGGADGAACRSDADVSNANCQIRLCAKAAAAHAACSALRAARASSNTQALVKALTACGTVAKEAPDEMVKAERESREQERLSGSPPPSYGGLDLSREGRVSLPTTPAALSGLSIAYNEAAVATCDAALAAAGGRGSPAAADNRRVPALLTEAQARGLLGVRLYSPGVTRVSQRSLELLRQAVALLRQAVRTAAPGRPALDAKQALASWLSNLGSMLNAHAAEGAVEAVAEAEACLREALELSQETNDVFQKQAVLVNLVNMGDLPGRSVEPAEAVAFRSRLNQLSAQTGQTPETSCTICLEPLTPLEQPGGGAEKGAVGDSRVADSSVRVLACGHQFHCGCLPTWRRTTSNSACPICKQAM